MFLETSARTGANVELAFDAIARELHKKSITAADRIGSKRNLNDDAFDLRDYVEGEREKSCC